MGLFEQVSKDIMTAMKARDKVRLEALRNIKKNFIEAKTLPGAGDELPDAKALSILSKMAKQGKETASLYRDKNRVDLAEEEEAQVKVIESYLPAEISDDELRSAVSAIIVKLGASGMKDMGRVMKEAHSSLSGKADGKRISDLVKQLLA